MDGDGHGSCYSDRKAHGRWECGDDYGHWKTHGVGDDDGKLTAGAKGAGMRTTGGTATRKRTVVETVEAKRS